MRTMTTFGDIVRPMPNSFWSVPLAPNAAIDTVNGPGAVAELIRQAGLAQPTINGSQVVPEWTLEPTWVPVDQPLVPVTCHHDTIMSEIAAAGVPIPATLNPTPDTDAALAVYQPDWSTPDGTVHGRYYELQDVARDPATGAISCNSLARQTNVTTPGTRGHFATWTSGYAGNNLKNPDSTYESAAWGIQGSGLPYAPGVLTLADVQRGYVNHVLLLEVYNAKSGAHVWPAQRSDGTAGSTDPASRVTEGQRLRWPAMEEIDAAWHPILQLIVQGGRDHGIILTDKTLNCLAFRCAPSVQAAGYFAGTSGAGVLAPCPWGDLQLQAVGSDTLQTPTS